MSTEIYACWWLVAYAKTKGFNTNVKGGTLGQDGRRYRYEEIHIYEDRAIVFQSPHSLLSNLYPCNVTYKGKAFLPSEAAFQFTKATECGYHREVQLIKQERNAKSLTTEFKHSGEWEENLEQVMREILIAKFKRNRICSSFSLATGERTLFEGTGDKKWGCRIPIAKAHQIIY